MADEKYCPDCGDALMPGTVKCACGWIRPKKQAAAVRRPCTCSDPNCSLPGTMATGSGQNPRWYCSWHFSIRSTPELCKDFQEFNAFVDKRASAEKEHNANLQKLGLKPRPLTIWTAKSPGELFRMATQGHREVA